MRQLTFSLVDGQGNEVSTQSLNESNIVWQIPREETMLTFDDYSDKNTKKIVGQRALKYSVRQLYNESYNNNEVQLTLLYNGKEIKAKTNFLFVKQGDPAWISNLNLQGRITPIKGAYQSLVFTHTIDTKTAKANYSDKKGSSLIDTASKKLQLLKFEIWKNGVNVFSGVENTSQVSLKWQIMKNNYNTKYSDFSYYTISNIGAIGLSPNINRDFFSDTYGAPANIVKCTAEYKYNGETFTLVDYFPIVTIKKVSSTSTFNISGLKNLHVKYDNYNSSPKMYSQLLMTINNYTSITWDCYGSYLKYNKFIKINNFKLITYKQKNKISYEPLYTYDGITLNNAIIGNIKNIGYIHVPIVVHNEIKVQNYNRIIAGKNKVTEHLIEGTLYNGDIQNHGLFGVNGKDDLFNINFEDGTLNFAGLKTRKKYSYKWCRYYF